MSRPSSRDVSNKDETDSEIVFEPYRTMLEAKSTADESGSGGVLSTSSEGDDDSTSTRNSRPRWFYVGIAVSCLAVLFLGFVVFFVVKAAVAPSPNESQKEQFDFTEITGGTMAPFTESPTEMAVAATSTPTRAPYTGSPTGAPVIGQTSNPTVVTSMPTALPTLNVSTFAPTVAFAPTELPTVLSIPTVSPAPYTEAPAVPVEYTSPTLTQFCVIADVPYYNSEAAKLPEQIATQMAGCEFMVHLGDIMRGEVTCTEVRYTSVRDILLTSPVATFIVVGDNEWNDCGGANAIAEGRSYWNANFLRLENNWNHTFSVVRHGVYEESFYFVHKRTLFFGLNVVGGKVHDSTEWADRLSSEQEWIEQIVQENIPLTASGVIIMAHGRPTYDHRHFFNPMSKLIGDSLNNTVPFLYLHGDGHKYIYTENFYDQPNYLRIQSEGGVRDPILRILSDPDRLGPLANDAFQHDRQLHFQR